MVVLSSNEAITDLIDKRSGIYADRVSGDVTLTFQLQTLNTQLKPQTAMMKL